MSTEANNPYSFNNCKEKLQHVTACLLERYASKLPLSFTLSRLAIDNPDLKISSINAWTRAVHKETAVKYLQRVGILSERNAKNTQPVSSTGSKSSGTRQKAATRSVNMVGGVRFVNFSDSTAAYYQDPRRMIVQSERFDVPELDVSGGEANDWVVFIPTKIQFQDPERIYLEDYIGEKEEIILPVSLNGIKIHGLKNYSFKECKAKSISVPGYYKEIPEMFFHENLNLESVTIGEGVLSIARYAFTTSRNLSCFRVSKSVEFVDTKHGANLSETKWYQEQTDYVVAGRILLAYKGGNPVMTVPEGVEIIAGNVLENNAGVHTVILPNTVTTLCEDAFFRSSNIVAPLARFCIPPSVTRIDHQAFHNTRWLKNQGPGSLAINGNLYRWESDENNVVIPDGVTRISSKIFMEKKILSVQFPASLKEIGEMAFQTCGKLSAVHFAEGLEHIGHYAFDRCYSLTEVRLPETLLDIGTAAFRGIGITTLRIGANTKSIGSWAFLQCRKLIDVVLKEGLIHIGKNAFSECESLREFVIPDTVTILGSGVLSDCTGLVHAELPSKMKEIPEKLFWKCNSLKSVKLPDEYVEIGGSAFQDCKVLLGISWSKQLRRIGAQAFLNCSSLIKAYIPGSTEKKAFGGCNALSSVEFEASTLLVSKEVFRGCHSLESLTFPENLARIEEGAFSGCKGLKKLEFPGSLRTIGQKAFSYCKNLETISFPESLHTIDAFAFSFCSSLEEVSLPASLHTLGDGAFFGSSKLSRVRMPSQTDSLGIRIFGDTPFYNETFDDFVVENHVLQAYKGHQTVVHVPDGVRIIADYAFQSQQSIRELYLPDSVEHIGKNIFSVWFTRDRDEWERIFIRNKKGSKLSRLVLGNGVKTIEEYAFSLQKNLELVVFGVSLEEIGYRAFCDCARLTSLDFGHTSLRCIGDKAFKECAKLGSIIFPETLEHIGQSAFEKAEIDAVKLPKSVKTVGNSAFAGCNELIVYDTIDSQGPSDEINSYSLPHALLHNDWKNFHITVLSAQTDRVKYRIYCDGNEVSDYIGIIYSGWGKNASFLFSDYDGYFEKLRNYDTKIETAFCRLMHPFGLSEEWRETYECFLMQSTWFDRNARFMAERIARADDGDRLQLLLNLGAVHEKNKQWFEKSFSEHRALNCNRLLHAVKWEQFL